MGIFRGLSKENPGKEKCVFFEEYKGFQKRS